MRDTIIKDRIDAHHTIVLLGFLHDLGIHAGVNAYTPPYTDSNGSTYRMRIIPKKKK